MKKFSLLVLLQLALFSPLMAQFSYKTMSEGIQNGKRNDNSKTDTTKMKLGDILDTTKAIHPFLLSKSNFDGTLKVKTLMADFFDGDSVNSHFFKNNNVVYNPKLSSMSISTEAVYDYFGPFRLGLGFQLNNVSEDEGEEKEQEKLISSVQNGGGDFFGNLKLPLFYFGKPLGQFSFKSYAYHNSGISVNKLNSAEKDFTLANNTGVAFGGMANGLENKIYISLEAKLALLYGNSEFRNILSSEKEDAPKVMLFSSVGLAISFMDTYTVKVDFYPVGHKIIRNDFPATFSFLITPKNKKNDSPE